MNSDYKIKFFGKQIFMCYKAKKSQENKGLIRSFSIFNKFDD
jgi:hypothetical protein